MDKQCSSCGGFCKKSGCERKNVDDDCYGYASRLAICIWEKHYKIESPNWKPSDTLINVLTQIDNMTSGLFKKQRPWVGLTPEERADCWCSSTVQFAINIEAKLKERNT